MIYHLVDNPCLLFWKCPNNEFFFFCPLLLYFNISSSTLSLFTNFLSEPHVSEHVDPSIGRNGVGALVDDNDNDSDDDDDNDSDKSTYLDDNDDGDDGNDDGGDNDSDNDDLIELMVGGEERMGSINKFGLTVGEVVVLLDAWFGVEL